MLQKWLYSGDLQDPYGEFFVAVNPEFSKTDRIADESEILSDVGLAMNQKGDNYGSSLGTRLWESKYQFRKDMLPRFVGESFGRKVKYSFIFPSILAYKTDILNW